MIHKTAIIGEFAKIGKNVKIGPYSIIENDTNIGDNSVIMEHVIIRKHTDIKSDCFIDSFAVIGGDPQDISFNRDTVSGISVGSHSVIREHATIHRATTENSNTIVGENCYIMACAHIGHDCILGDNVIMANCALLGGFAKIDDHCFIGGGAAVHQRVHVGEYTILGGYSATSLDLPPYVMSAGASRVVGLNIVGLKRANFSSEKIFELKRCLTNIYNTPGRYCEIAQQMLDSGNFKSEESKKFLKFFTSNSQQGIAPLRKKIKHTS